MDIKLLYLTLSLWILCMSSFMIQNAEAYYNYHFMEETCNASGVHIDLTQETSTYGFVRMNRDGGYSANLHCKMTIWAPEQYHITVRFRRVEIYRPDKDCTTDYLNLSGNSTTHTFCGTGTPGYALVSTGRYLQLEFFSGSWTFDNDRMGFDLYYTAFHQGPCDTDDGEEFECWRDYRCIPGELKCDNLDNCGDWSDERAATCGLPAGTIVMITLLSVLCCGTCIAAGVYFACDKKKDSSRRRRRQNQTDVLPSVEYNLNQGPPPYSSYFTTPPYTAQDEKPPAYSNYGYDQPAALATESTNAAPESTDVTAVSAEETSRSSSSGVVTPPTGSRRNSPVNQTSDYDSSGLYDVIDDTKTESEDSQNQSSA